MNAKITKEETKSLRIHGEPLKDRSLTARDLPPGSIVFSVTHGRKFGVVVEHSKSHLNFVTVLWTEEGREVLRIDSSGGLGIGITAPWMPLR